MEALKFFLVAMGLLGVVKLALITADHHYKTYTGEEPLDIIYALLFVITYASILIFIHENF